MNEMTSISVQALNGIFAFVEKYTPAFFWIQTARAEKQIYIGDKFEEFYQKPVDFIYADPKNFFDLFSKEKRTNMLTLVKKRQALFEKQKRQYEMHTQAALPSGGMLFTRDISFQLFDDYGNPRCTVGAVSKISEQEFSPNILIPVENKTEQGDFYKVIQSVFKTEFNLNTEQPQEVQYQVKILGRNPIKLPPREAECLQHALLGKSSKIIARELGISFRTVQCHLAKVKTRLDARTLFELLANIMNRDEILSWEFK